MSKTILIRKQERLNETPIKLSSSKSESNRALIINALTGNRGVLHNLSDARDTATMQRLLKSPEHELDVMDAGTTMRFLTAYFATGKEHKSLHGTPRMNERPIRILVDALVETGANITYKGVEGFPPLEIRPFERQLKDHVKVAGNVSSQYISALLMTAPRLPKGLSIELTGEVNSRPYIDMTLALMEKFGIEIRREDDRLYTIKPQKYRPVDYHIESDWSGASYWYSMVALAKAGSVKLLGLKKNSLQGDSVIAAYMEKLGVVSKFESDGVAITKSKTAAETEFDFTHCPDLAQTLAVTCAAKGIPSKMSGLASLRIKETDRVTALQNELAKIGARLEEEGGDQWSLIPGSTGSYENKDISIKTYDDHRMAMAFAPLATLTDLRIQDPEVVRKSYPGFWEDMKKAGFSISEIG